MEGATVSSFISILTEIFTAVLGYVGNVADVIMSEPLLLVFTAVPLVGIGVGMFKRLINVN